MFHGTIHQLNGAFPIFSIVIMLNYQRVDFSSWGFMGWLFHLIRGPQDVHSAMINHQLWAVPLETDIDVGIPNL